MSKKARAPKRRRRPTIGQLNAEIAKLRCSLKENALWIESVYNKTIGISRTTDKLIDGVRADLEKVSNNHADLLTRNARYIESSIAKLNYDLNSLATERVARHEKELAWVNSRINHIQSDDFVFDAELEGSTLKDIVQGQAKWMMDMRDALEQKITMLVADRDALRVSGADMHLQLDRVTKTCIAQSEMLRKLSAPRAPWWTRLVPRRWRRA